MLIHWDVHSGNNRDQDPVDQAHVSSSCCIWSTSSPALAIFQSLQSLVLLRVNIYWRWFNLIHSHGWINLIFEDRNFHDVATCSANPFFFFWPRLSAKTKSRIWQPDHTLCFFSRLGSKSSTWKGGISKTKTCRKPEDSADSRLHSCIELRNSSISHNPPNIDVTCQALLIRNDSKQFEVSRRFDDSKWLLKLRPFQTFGQNHHLKRRNWNWNVVWRHSWQPYLLEDGRDPYIQKFVPTESPKQQSQLRFGLYHVHLKYITTNLCCAWTISKNHEI